MKIPKVFHWCWGLGHLNDVVPEDGRTILRLWQELHPDWELRQWTRDNLPPMSREVDVLYRCSENSGHRADVLRYWLLHSQGGVYIDADMWPDQCLEPLLEDVVAFAGEHAPQRVDGGLIQTVEIAILGSVPGYSLWSYVLDAMPAWWKWRARNGWQSGDVLSPSTMTGPQYFQLMLAHCLQAGLQDFELFAPEIFYPYWADATPEVKAGPFPGSYAHHLWWGRWMAPAEGMPDWEQAPST